MANNDLSSRWFSFREWQRYIECRRTILMKKHFATKFKNDSDGFGGTELYINFITSALSRREEKPVITNPKNCLPRELSHAMKQCISTFEKVGSLSENIEIFPPCKTPQYSYLEQILENPMYEVPLILRKSFNKAKLCYSINPKKFIKVAAKYDIKLDKLESRLHFIDKFVPLFEVLKMPPIDELNTSVMVEYCSEEEDKEPFEHSRRKNSCQGLSINLMNRSLYDAVQEKAMTHQEKYDSDLRRLGTRFSAVKSDEEEIDFGFDNVTSDGKLAIGSPHRQNRNDKSLNFYKKYNLQLPRDFTLNKSDSIEIKYDVSRNLPRDSGGKFIKKDSPKRTKTGHVFKRPRRITSSPESTNTSPCKPEIENITSTNQENDKSFHSKNTHFQFTQFTASEKLFIPSKDYWTCHCVFSRIKPKHFDAFESELPVSFQWLLSECADVVEMTTEDLYEQVCLIETYFAHVLTPIDIETEPSQYMKNNRRKIKICEKKW